MHFCPNCGTEISEDDKFCYSCGANLGELQQEIPAAEEGLAEEIAPEESERMTGEEEPPREVTPTKLKAGLSGLKIFLTVMLILVVIGLVSVWGITQSQYEALKAEYGALKTESNRFYSDYRALENKTSNLLRENESLRSQYNEIKVDYGQLEASYLTVSQKLSNIKEAYKPRPFPSVDELRAWLISNDVSERPKREYLLTAYLDALDIQKDAFADGYLVSAVVESLGEEGVDVYCQAYVEGLTMEGHVVPPWLGIEFSTVYELTILQYNLAVDEGVLVNIVVSGSPADNAGLATGDVIISLNGKDITSSEDLSQNLSNCQIGQEVEITFWRGNTQNTTSTILCESPLPPDGGIVWWYPDNDEINIYPLE